MRRWVGNLVLLLVSVGFMLGLCEIAARIAFAHRRGKEQAEIRRYTLFDPDVGWVKEPGAHVRYTRTEFDVEVDINSLGHRDRERSLTPAPGTQRVLALGDSFLEGFTVDAHEMVTQVMERALTRPNCPVEVLNSGTSGYSTDQELVYYRAYGRRLQPQVVVVFLYYNDIVANTTHTRRSKPEFALKDGKLVLVRKAQPPPRRRQVKSPPQAEAPSGSAAWAWLKYRVRRASPSSYNRVAALGVWPPLRQTQDVPDEMLVYRGHVPRRVQRAWRLTGALLATLAREVEADGAHFLVAYVPSRMEVRDVDWDATRILYGMGRKWHQDAVVRRIEKIGLKRGFDVLDLTPALRGAESRWLGSTYFTFDGHWNARGHRVAGESVARDLTLRGWIRTCPDKTR